MQKVKYKKTDENFMRLYRMCKNLSYADIDRVIIINFMTHEEMSL